MNIMPASPALNKSVFMPVRVEVLISELEILVPISKDAG
jgi:hypothetical protein